MRRISSPIGRLFILLPLHLVIWLFAILLYEADFLRVRYLLRKWFFLGSLFLLRSCFDCAPGFFRRCKQAPNTESLLATNPLSRVLEPLKGFTFFWNLVAF